MMSKELIERLRELSAKRKPYATGAHGQMIGMESYRIVANGFALECIDEAADRIEELERERDAFYMDYRMKCDEEAKGSALVIIERDQLRAKLSAEQAKNVELREALHYSLGAWEYDGISDEHGSIFQEACSRCDAPSDTSALEAIVKKAGEVMRERSINVAWNNEPDCNGPIEMEIRALPAVTLEDLK